MHENVSNLCRENKIPDLEWINIEERKKEKKKERNQHLCQKTALKAINAGMRDMLHNPHRYLGQWWIPAV